VRNLNVYQYPLSARGAIAILSGCGVLSLSLSKGENDVQPPIGASGTMPQTMAERARPRVTYNALYGFGGYPSDGAGPDAGLIDESGTLYSTIIYLCTVLTVAANRTPKSMIFRSSSPCG
jgi:hypothetical protein